jgi:MFS family permease
VCALLGASLTTRFSPKRIVEVGLLSMLSGGILLIAFTEPTLRSIGFSVALALVGAGNGLLVSQLGNVIMSSVSSERSSEAGGLQGTAQNLGASLGTALVGSMLIASLVGNFQQAVLANPALTDISDDLVVLAEENANFITTDQLRAGAEAAGLSQAQIEALVVDYADAQIVALKAAFAVVVLFALIALWYVRRLPSAAQPADPAALTPSST